VQRPRTNEHLLAFLANGTSGTLDVCSIVCLFHAGDTTRWRHHRNHTKKSLTMNHFYLRAKISLALTFAVFGVKAEVSYIPIQFRTVSGIRPFVQASLNGKQLFFMVHSETDFYVMTNHANASIAGPKNLVKTTSFGISAPGHVDNRGRAETTIGELTVGSSRSREVPLSVFETMQDPPMDGMLGVKWLQQQKVIVDFD